MKKIFCSSLFLGFAMLAHGQQAPEPVPAAGQVNRMDVERARISSARTSLENGFLTEDAACYKRFAVNKCLGEVNDRRREAMADLRRQELSLNDEERKIRGADQIRKTEEKTSPEKLQEAADNRAKAQADYQARLDRERQKQQDKATVQSSEKSNSEAAAGKIKANQDKARARVDQSATAAEEARKYAEKQKESEERRAQHARDQAARIKEPAKSLPLPQ